MISDTNSEMDWRLEQSPTCDTLSLPHRDSPDRTRRRTTDTVAQVISGVASNLDFIPPMYSRNRPRRLPRGWPNKYKRRPREY
ncbi:hypothetical protein M8J76_016746 [Diaphorina citri]|nr:hypothetical protein M8J75_001481 [Diaphorina citri]KAI5709379.1 hypothetical protein M8J76_016746 [Diaphorina citri]